MSFDPVPSSERQVSRAPSSSPTSAATSSAGSRCSWRSGGTGYAAASHAHSNTINACANKTTGQLSIRHGARCKRGQVKVSWAKQGPKGPAGTSAIQAFGAVGATGIVIPNGGISVQHTGPGIFVVTATSPGCANGLNDPTVTATTAADRPGSRRRARRRTAWIDANGGAAQFTVHTGWISGGSFTPADYGFDLQDSCVPSGSRTLASVRGTMLRKGLIVALAARRAAACAPARRRPERCR